MIEISKLSKSYENNGKTQNIFSHFNLNIKKGEKVGLFGSNGSGKSTLLNIISTVDSIEQGHVIVNAKRISYMHQDASATLAPWFTCEKNILLILEYHGLSVKKGKALLKKLVKELKIDFSLKKYPFMLSGGQKQIVSLMRALIFEPDLLLMDEPFSALDITKRADVARVLKNHFDKDLTVVLCSHRGDEVASLLNRAIVLGKNKHSVDKDIHVVSSRKNFVNTVSKIQFRRNEI